MDKLLILCGPTATGKTSLAVQIAKDFDGELISADSRQVYRGMDIGTGKDVDENAEFRILNSGNQTHNEKISIGYRSKDGIPVWLVDIVDPDYRFNVGDYISCAKIAIEDVQKRHRLPIIVGGTGLYVKGILEPFATAHIPPNDVLRRELEGFTREELALQLQSLAEYKWQSMNISDRLNPRRLIRAIEIAKYKEQHPTTKSSTSQSSHALQIGLSAANDVLYRRIDERVDERVAKGSIQEVRSLLAKGYSWDKTAMDTYGYKEWKEYITGQQTKEETIQKWKYDEHEYARKQLTWFRKQPGITWVDCTDPNLSSRVREMVRTWYTAGV